MKRLAGVFLKGKRFRGAPEESSAAGNTVLLVPTVSADCRRAVDALGAGAILAGRSLVLAPPHRLEAAAAATEGPIVLLTVSRGRAVLDAMRRGVPPSAALVTLAQEMDFARAASARHGCRARRADVAAVEAGAPLGALLDPGRGDGILEAQHPTTGGLDAEDVDPVLGLIAAAAAAGVGDAAVWDAAFRRHRALGEEAAALAREAAAWTRGQLSGGDETARLTAAITVLEAEGERLRGEIVRLEDALVEGLVGESRPRRHEIDIAGAAVLHPAFYDAERTGDRPFRWLGREAEARIATAVPRRAAARVDVTVEMAISRAALEGFGIGLDSMDAETVTLSPLDRGRVLVSATFPGEEDAPAFVRRELRLRAGTRVDLSAEGDPRTLAVAISRIVIDEVEDVAKGAGEGTGMAPDKPAEAVREILAERIVHRAFHGPEHRGDGMSLRWMGREDEADLPVRLPRGVPVRITVCLAAAVASEVLSAFSIAVDGVAAAAAETIRDAVGGAETSAVFLLAGSRSRGGRTARLTLSAPGAHSPHGDPRRLSVAVHAIRIETVPGTAAAETATAVPSPPPFSILFDAARDLATPAFWGLENGHGRPYRWLGRGDRTSLPVVVPPGRALAVAAEIVTALDEAALEGFEITLGGMPADETILERRRDGSVVKTALFPAMEGGPVAVGLLARRRAVPGGGDPRMLAVALSRITVDAF